MIKQQIGQNIKAIRNLNGYSQEKFSKIVGLDRTYIASVENGKRNISVANLIKLRQL